jgi:uncharacterized protein GlcG (DUF336 family)
MGQKQNDYYAVRVCTQATVRVRESDMKRFTRSLFAVGFVAIGSQMQSQLPSQKVLTFDVSLNMAQDAMSKCRADGYHVTVSVVDAGNAVRVVLRDDKAFPSTLDVSRLKAGSVVIFGRPSGPPPNLAPGQPVPAPVVPGTINGVGGIPIIVNGTIIGAIGVSGAPSGEKDADCAKAGVERVTDLLK